MTNYTYNLDISRESLLSFDRALRGARHRALPAGSLSDLLWEILTELELRCEGDSLCLVEDLSIPNVPNATLIRCLAVLEKDGFIEGKKDRWRMFTEIRPSAVGRALIGNVLAEAAASFERRSAARSVGE